MSANEGPKRSDFQESARLPDCGPHCEHIHGDQAPSAEDLVIASLQRANEQLKAELADARFGWDKANEQRSDWCERALHAEREVLRLKAEHAKRHDELTSAWAEIDGAKAEAAAAKRERDALRSALQDPAAVRSNILTGAISVPGDLVWLNDSHGPVAHRVEEEREAIAQLVRDQGDDEGFFSDFATATGLAAAILARGGP